MVYTKKHEMILYIPKWSIGLQHQHLHIGLFQPKKFKQNSQQRKMV